MPVENLTVNVGPAGSASYSFTKQPADKLKYTFDYSEWLSDSEGVTIASATTTLKPDDVALNAPTITASTNDQTHVYVTINGGQTGYGGYCTCLATLSDGRIKEAEFNLYVTEY